MSGWISLGDRWGHDNQPHSPTFQRDPRALPPLSLAHTPFLAHCPTPCTAHALPTTPCHTHPQNGRCYRERDLSHSTHLGVSGQSARTNACAVCERVRARMCVRMHACCKVHLRARVRARACLRVPAVRMRLLFVRAPVPAPACVRVHVCTCPYAATASLVSPRGWLGGL